MYDILDFRFNRSTVVLVLLVMFSMLWASESRAALIRVNTAEDSRDGTCDPTPGDCSLFEAMEASNADPGPSRISISVKLAADPATVLDISDGPLPPVTTPVTITGQGLAVDTVGGPFIIDPSGGSLGLEWLGVFTD